MCSAHINCAPIDAPICVHRSYGTTIFMVHKRGLTLWCPLLPYGYSYKESCARLG